MCHISQRERVTMIVNSENFSNNLGSIVTATLKPQSQPASLIVSQQTSKYSLFLPHTSSLTTVSSLSRASGSLIVPINDLHDIDSTGYPKNERLLRCKLASLYRLIDLFRWSQGIYNHITVSV
jgi:adducin